MAATLRRAGVREILLLHGTFMGGDAFGFAREFSRFSTRAGRALRKLTKGIVNQVVGEAGNFTSEYATDMGKLLNADGAKSIGVSVLDWGGENHHLGRAEGAVILLHHLLQRSWADSDRVLVWGHSHGGNVLALASQLLGASGEMRSRFFAAARSHYRHPLIGRIDLPAWDEVRSALEQRPRKTLPDIDYVTFGTPLRYRWGDAEGARLMHFVNHRPLIEASPAQAQYPESIEEVMGAHGGDYIQQLGIAGTDFPPNIFAWRSWKAELRLRRLLQRGVRRRDLMRHLRRGLRVSLDGLTLLVDYPDTPPGLRDQIAGHGIYTSSAWLPFHLREVARRYYPSE